MHWEVTYLHAIVQGLAFENVNEAIKTGLIVEDPPEESILERVLTGTLVEEPED